MGVVFRATGEVEGEQRLGVGARRTRREGHVRQAAAGACRASAAQRPAFRHKDFGIWQTWTWARGLCGDARGRPGLARARPRPGRHDRHRRRQSPAPLLVDHGGADDRRDPRARLRRIRSPTRSPRCSNHSEATVIVAQDQEQVDKILSVRDRLPRLRHLLYDEPRGLTDYDEPGLHALESIMAKGRERARRCGRRSRPRPAHRRAARAPIPP